MNDFERKLLQQAFREIPSEWRAGILPPQEEATVESVGFAWREWLWPSPHAWGALAAVWVVLACLDQFSRPHHGGTSSVALPSTPPPTSLFALNRYEFLEANY